MGCYYFAKNTFKSAKAPRTLTRLAHQVWSNKAPQARQKPTDGMCPKRERRESKALADPQDGLGHTAGPGAALKTLKALHRPRPGDQRGPVASAQMTGI